VIYCRASTVSNKLLLSLSLDSGSGEEAIKILILKILKIIVLRMIETSYDREYETDTECTEMSSDEDSDDDIKHLLKLNPSKLQNMFLKYQESSCHDSCLVFSLSCVDFSYFLFHAMLCSPFSC